MEYSHQKLAKMCKKIKKKNFTNDLEYSEYEKIAKPIIDKVNRPQYNVSRQEAEFLMMFYAKKSLRNLGVNKRVDITIYSREKMFRNYSKGNGKAIPDDFNCAIAVSNPNDLRIIYSEELIDDIASGNPDKMYRAFRTIMHETKHIEQAYRRKSYSIDNYIMAIEAMAMMVEPNVYLNNYWKTYRECDAERYGIEAAYEKLPGLYKVTDQTNFKEKWANIEAGVSGKTDIVLGRIYDEDGKRLLEGSEYSEQDKMCILEHIAEEYMKKHPKKAFREYPVLHIAFKDDGTRKDVFEILTDTLALEQTENRDVVKEQIEEMCLYVIANRFPINYEKDRREAETFVSRYILKQSFVKLINQTINSIRNQDIKGRKIKSNLMKYGIGMSKAARSRRKDYVETANKKEPKKEVRGRIEGPTPEELVRRNYNINVPVVNNTTRGSNNYSKRPSDEGR